MRKYKLFIYVNPLIMYEYITFIIRYRSLLKDNRMHFYFLPTINNLIMKQEILMPIFMQLEMRL